jgi:hypothetical protein
MRQLEVIQAYYYHYGTHAERKRRVVVPDLDVDDILWSMAYLDMYGRYGCSDLFWLGANSQGKLRVRSQQDRMASDTNRIEIPDAIHV